MIKAVLFDLDGTLLPVDIDEFFLRYIAVLQRRFEHLVEPGEFARKLMASTYKMIANQDPSRTLSEVFWADFAPSVNCKIDMLLPEVMDFYATDFCQLKGCIFPDPDACSVPALASQMGYDIVLATNPLFPRQAIIERMRWAGIDRLPWKLITSYEDMHFSKPNIRYYTEIADRLGVKPEECVMVGNDTRDDLVAGKVGMKTYLVEGFHIERSDGYEPDWRGSLADLAGLIKRRFRE